MEHLQRATHYTESFTWIILSLPRNTQHHHYPHCCIWGNEDTETLDNMTSMWPRSGPNLGTGTPEPVFSDSSILSSGDPAPHLSHVSGSQSDLSRANSTSQQIEVLSYYTLGQQFPNMVVDPLYQDHQGWARFGAWESARLIRSPQWILPIVPRALGTDMKFHFTDGETEAK